MTLAELYDYQRLRTQSRASVSVVRPTYDALVLGSTQSDELVRRDCTVVTRRRRGGGGIVLVGPGDLWVDWWIPTGDARWRADARAAAQLAGSWWFSALRGRVADLSVHAGGLVGEREHRLVCFAGRGPGEVFVGERKAVGVTQWRVREGIFLSTLIPAHSTRRVLPCLSQVPEGLDAALEHHTRDSLGLDDVVLEALLDVSGPWDPGVAPTL